MTTFNKEYDYSLKSYNKQKVIVNLLKKLHEILEINILFILANFLQS